METAEALLATAARGLIALPGASGPSLEPVPCWFDGTSLWTAVDAASVGSGPQHEVSCALYLPGTPEAVVVAGSARVLSLRADLLGTLLRAPVIGGALTGLALESPGTLLGYARHAARLPGGRAARERAVLRVTVAEALVVEPADAPPGLAPALPAVVAADVRRALVGERRVVVARSAAGAVEIVPAAWDRGFAITALPAATPLEAVGQVTVALEAGAGDGHPTPRGLALAGPLERGVLSPLRAAWWHGFDVEAAPVPVATPGVVLPD